MSKKMRGGRSFGSEKKTINQMKMKMMKQKGSRSDCRTDDDC